MSLPAACGRQFLNCRSAVPLQQRAVVSQCSSQPPYGFWNADRSLSLLSRREEPECWVNSGSP
jgi:hypothetical protein